MENYLVMNYYNKVNFTKKCTIYFTKFNYTNMSTQFEK